MSKLASILYLIEKMRKNGFFSSSKQEVRVSQVEIIKCTKEMQETTIWVEGSTVNHLCNLGGTTMQKHTLNSHSIANPVIQNRRSEFCYNIKLSFKVLWICLVFSSEIFVSKRKSEVYMFQVTNVLTNVPPISSWSLNKLSSYFEVIKKTGSFPFNGMLFFFL